MKNLIQWQPLTSLNSIFDGSLSDTFPMSNTDLAVDVYEKDSQVIAEMNIPGVSESDIDISLEDDLLTISGQREAEKETKEKNYYSKEIKRGAFSRTVRLPRAVDSSQARAEYKGGVLRVTMPVDTEAKEKSIKVPISK